LRKGNSIGSTNIWKWLTQWAVETALSVRSDVSVLGSVLPAAMSTITKFPSHVTVLARNYRTSGLFVHEHNRMTAFAEGGGTGQCESST
jgi:hypothetical protein